MPRAQALNEPSPGDPDRKRVLNVLAQRRYRQRKKERYAALEAQARAQAGANSSSTHSSVFHESPEDLGSSEADVISSSSEVSLAGFQGGLQYLDAPGTTENTPFGIQVLLDQPEVGYTPGQFEFQNGMIRDAEQTYMFPRPAKSPPSLPMSVDTPLLKLMQVAMLHVEALDCGDLMWDPSSVWTLTPAHAMRLPASLQPTEAQLTIPHHPMFDILPWPALRTKLIYIFSLALELRPHAARDPMAITNLAYDIEDEVEGFRINGTGNLPDDWEVGEAFARNWQWALDRKIVETSNAWRVKRGENRLMIKPSNP